jgi:hypothetical protein
MSGSLNALYVAHTAGTTIFASQRSTMPGLERLLSVMINNALVVGESGGSDAVQLTYAATETG